MSTLNDHGKDEEDQVDHGSESTKTCVKVSLFDLTYVILKIRHQQMDHSTNHTNEITFLEQYFNLILFMTSY